MMVKKLQACSLEGTDDEMNEVWNEISFGYILHIYIVCMLWKPPPPVRFPFVGCSVSLGFDL